MVLELDEILIRRLEAIAEHDNKDINEIVRTVIEKYVAEREEREDFKARIRKHMQDQKWLLDELAKR
jgi:hypothetical protein